MAPCWMLALLLTALLVGPPPVAAETRYVSDQLIIALRSGPETGAQALTTLKSDTPLDILEDLGKFLKVRIPDGREGYVLSQYVTSDQPKTLRLAGLERERDELQKKIAKLENSQKLTTSERAAELQEEVGRKAELQRQADQLTQDLAEARKDLQDVTGRYEALRKAAEDVANIVQERERLKEQNDRLAAEVESLQGANESMLRTAMIRWFLAGGGVFLVGWLAGKLSRQKRRGF